MPNVIEIVSPLAESALVIAPALADVPILGRVIVALAGAHPLTETQAMEQMQKSLDAEKKLRQKELDDNNRYVVKVSDAIKCTQDHLLTPRIILDFGRGLFNALAGKQVDAGFAQIVYGKIRDCIISHSLRQDTPRVKIDTPRYHRPSKGHGKGRKSF